MKNLNDLLIKDNDEIVEFMNEKEFDYSDLENYWVFNSESESRICLVCHVDTVSKYLIPVVLEENKDMIRNKFGVLGADDRAGMFAAFDIMEKTGCMALFMNYEEGGARGARKFCDDFDDLNIFPNIDLFIELDRKGAKEFVTYNYLSSETREYVKNHGFKEGIGTFSDIALLCESFEIQGVNLSIGYYNEHTQNEYLYIPFMFDTIRKVIKMIKEDNVPKNKFEKLQYNYSKYSNVLTYQSDYENYYNLDFQETIETILEAEGIYDEDITELVYEILDSNDFYNLVVKTYDFLCLKSWRNKG